MLIFSSRFQTSAIPNRYLPIFLSESQGHRLHCGGTGAELLQEGRLLLVRLRRDGTAIYRSSRVALATVSNYLQPSPNISKHRQRDSDLAIPDSLPRSVGNGPLRSGFKVNAGAGFFNFPLHRTGGFRCDRGNRNGNAPELLIKILNTHRSMNISGLHRNGAIYGRRRRITPEFQKEPETRDCIELRL